MKSFLLSFLFLGFTTFCSQEEKKPNIIGSWNWIESSGGIAGKTINPESTGDKITIVLTKDKYTKYINDEINTEMSYKIELGKSITKRKETYLIVYESGQKQSIVLNKDELILFDECYDCYQNNYVRK